MTKQEKINKLTKKIEELSAKLEKLEKESEKPIVEVYADRLVYKQYYRLMDVSGKIYDYLFFGDKYDHKLKSRHKIRPMDQDLTQEKHYQLIIDRMRELAYELNPKDWDWKDPDSYSNKFDDFLNKFYELRYSHKNKIWWVCGLYDNGPLTILPKFRDGCAAQKAADQLNQDGYKL